MRQQILVATAAILLVVVFLAAWALSVPGVPDLSFQGRAKPEPMPTLPPTPPAPTPPPATPTLMPTPTPTLLPAPTPTPTPQPTATPIPTATPPPPPPTPESQFLTVHDPQHLDAIYGPPQVSVSGSTLPWSLVEIIYASGAQTERDMRVQADGSGDFSAIVPLAEGINVIEVISYHGASAEQIRQFLQLGYKPTEATLELVITEPADGTTVATRVLTIVGATAPDAQVVLNDIIPAHPDDEGRWEATIFLQRGSNEIHATASLEDETVQATITVTYDPGQ